MPSEGIIEVRNVEFTGNGNLKCLMKGEGTVSIRLDDKNGKDIATIACLDDNWQSKTTVTEGELKGTHTLYLILKGNVQLDTWQFVDETETNIENVVATKEHGEQKVYDIHGRKLNSIPHDRNIYIVGGKKCLLK